MVNFVEPSFQQWDARRRAVLGKDLDGIVEVAIVPQHADDRRRHVLVHDEEQAELLAGVDEVLGQRNGIVRAVLGLLDRSPVRSGRVLRLVRSCPD